MRYALYSVWMTITNPIDILWLIWHGIRPGHDTDAADRGDHILITCSCGAERVDMDPKGQTR